MASLGFDFPGPFGDDDSVLVVEYRRMTRELLPPGRVWRWLSSSLLFKVFDACAEEVGRIEARVRDLFFESDPTTALELVPEYEAELDLEASGTIEERQARIVARHVARQRVRPVDYQNALAPLLGQEPADVVVIERSRADAIAMNDDREIYRFFIYRDPALPGAYYVDAAQALVDAIAHSHTQGHVIESIDFLCDDPFSLTDRDILGA